jgi:hypothetical protein
MEMSVAVLVGSSAPSDMSYWMELTPTPCPTWLLTLWEPICWLIRVLNIMREDLKPTVLTLAMLSEMTDMFSCWAMSPVVPI